MIVRVKPELQPMSEWDDQVYILQQALQKTPLYQHTVFLIQSNTETGIYFSPQITIAFDSNAIFSL
jgi:hypothetical protein